MFQDYNLAMPPNLRKRTSTMPFEGVNEITLPQALSPNQATLIENYFITKQFELARRRGSKKRQEVASNTNPIAILKQWTDTLIILGYGTVLAIFNSNDNTINSIKTDFAKDLTDGLRWGNDFFSCSGRMGDKIYKTTLPTLAYDAQSANFTAGLTITGGTSGATATIISDSDGGATGTLTLDNIDGVFVNDEALTDSSTGAAVVNGTMTYTNTAAVAAAPKCDRLAIFDLRLHAVSTDSGESWVHAAKLNDFTTWTAGSNAGDPYIVKFLRAGKAVDMGNLQNTASGSESFGDIGVIFYKDGKYAFTNETIDVGGTLTQKQSEFFTKLDDGGERGVLTTPLGIFYGNENGEFLIMRNGSKKNLTGDFSSGTIADLDASDSDRVYLPERDLLLITLKNASQRNNTTYWFDTNSLSRKKITWGKITGWSINRFLLIGRTLFGGSSTAPKVMELLPDNVWDDENGDVYYKYNQPFNVGQLETVKDLLRLDMGAYLSSGTELKIEVYGLDEEGNWVHTGITYTFTGTGGAGELEGWGEAEWGTSGFDSINAPSGTKYQEAKGEKKAYNYKAYSIRISGNDKLPNVLAYLSIQAREGRLQRKSQLT